MKCCGLSLKNIKPNTNYIVSVASQGTSSRVSEVKTIKIKTDVGASPVFSSPNISRNAITEEYIPIYLYAASNINGIIRCDIYLSTVTMLSLVVPPFFLIIIYTLLIIHSFKKLVY